MSMDNTLNVSELLKRLGVVGDSVGSAPLLDQLRLVINIADLSSLVPPVSGPVAAAYASEASGVGKVNKWNLRCGAPGGMRVTSLASDTSGNDYNVWITDDQPFIEAPTIIANADFAFGQVAESIFVNYEGGVAVVPANSLELPDGTITAPILSAMLPTDNWVGPGQFFNIESRLTQTTSTIYITWKEYPAMINP